MKLLSVSEASVGNASISGASVSKASTGKPSRKLAGRHAWVWAFAAAALIVSPVDAQDDNARDADDTSADTQIDEVLVFGTRMQERLSGTGRGIALEELPQNVSVLSGDLLDDLQIDELDQAMTLLGGVTKEAQGIFADRYAIRGFTTDKNRRDGYIRGNSFVEPFFTERIEVVRGPSSLLYGRGSPGGVVSISSKRPEFERQNRIRLGAGSESFYQIGLDFTGPLNDQETMAYRFLYANSDKDSSTYRFRTEKREGLQAGLTWKPVEQVTLFADFERIEVDAVNSFESPFALRPGADPLDISPDDVVADPNDNGFGPGFEACSDCGSVSEQDIVTFEASWEVNDNLVLSAAYNEFERELYSRTRQAAPFGGEGTIPTLNFGDTTYYLSNNPADSAGNLNELYIPNLRDESTFKADIAYYFENSFVSGRAFIGYEKLERRNSNQFFFFFFDDTNNPFAPFFADGSNVTPEEYATLSAEDLRWFSQTDTGEIDFRKLGDAGLSISDDNDESIYFNVVAHLFDERLHLVAGGRFADVEIIGSGFPGDPVQRIEDDANVFQAGVTYDFTDNFSVFANYSESFEPSAALDENNVPLGPEEGTGIDFGFRFNLLDGQLRGTATYFDIELTNIVDLVIVDGVVLNRPVGEVTSDGFEFELTYTPLDNLFFAVSAGFQDPRVSAVGEASANQPGDRLEASVDTSVGFVAQYEILEGNLAGLQFTLDGDWRDDITINEALQNFVSESRTIVNVGAVFPIGNFGTLGVKVNNVADELVFERLAAWGEGRTYRATWSYDF